MGKMSQFIGFGDSEWPIVNQIEFFLQVFRIKRLNAVGDGDVSGPSESSIHFQKQKQTNFVEIAVFVCGVGYVQWRRCPD